MSKFGSLLLVLALVGAAFFLGTRVRQPAPAPVAKTTISPEAAAAAERAVSALPSSQAPRTFLGPEGYAELISYDSANPPDNNDPEQVRAGLLADMRNHPGNIQRSYGVPLADIEAMVAGKRPVPDAWLPPRDPATAPTPPEAR